MKKEDLIKLGLDEEMAKKVERATEDDLISFVKTLEEEALERQIDAVEEKALALKNEYENTIAKMKVENAIDVALLKSTARNNVAAKALLDMEKISIDENGEVKGLSEQIEALRASDDTKFLFGESAPSTVIEGVKPGEGSGNFVEITKEQFDKMGYKERTDLYENDRAAYDALCKE